MAYKKEGVLKDGSPGKAAAHGKGRPGQDAGILPGSGRKGIEFPAPRRQGPGNHRPLGEQYRLSAGSFPWWPKPTAELSARHPAYAPGGVEAPPGQCPGRGGQ